MRIAAAWCGLLLLSLPLAAEPPFERMSASTVFVHVPVNVEVPMVHKRGTLDGSGSGFFVGDGRHFVTNYHVCCQPERSIDVEGHAIPVNEIGRSVEIELDQSTKIQARVLWQSAEKDLAILELERDSGRKPVTLSPHTLATAGEKVYAIGYPGTAARVRDEATRLKPTITDGIISAFITPNEKYGVGSASQLFQISAAVNPGNSGGPLFNACGEVVGINDATAIGVQGVHYSIQADELLGLLDGRTALSGVTVNASVASRTCAPDGGVNMSSPWVLLQVLTAILAIGSLTFAFVSKRGRAMVKQSTTSFRRAQNPQNLQGQQGQGGQVFQKPLGNPLATKQPVLRGLSGYYAGKNLRMDDNGFVIGRDPRVCNLVFPPDMEKISKRHCSLKFDRTRGRFVLEDTWSMNGTFLMDGQRVVSGQPSELDQSGRFYLADRENSFEVAVE